MSVSIVQAAFTSGEWSPRLFGRVDLEKYGAACSCLENMLLMPHGAAKKRMGTEMISAIVSPEICLIPFVFSNKQSYVLELTPFQMRFFRDGALVPLTLSTEWDAKDLAQLKWTQSADILYLVCHRIRPYQVMREGPDQFRLNPVEFNSMPSDWTDQDFPSAVTFHQQRLWYAATVSKPQTLWASRIADFDSFYMDTEADSALSITLLSEQVNAIHWLMSSRTLLVGTGGGEWSISGSTPEEAITIKTMQATRNSNFGDGGVPPVLIGRSVIHVSGDTKRVRELAYSFADDGYISTDISLFAEHITSQKVKRISYAPDPDGIIWCVLQDGSLAGCTYLRSQDVVAWHRHLTQGKVLSVVCVPSNNTSLCTDTYLAVQRQNGIYMERMLPTWEGETCNEPECFFVDSGLTYQGDPSSTIQGLEHLEGQSVNILADGLVHTPCIVVDGKITLAQAAKLVIVGLGYSSKLSPMLPEINMGTTLQGKKKKLYAVNTRCYKSLGLQYGLQDANKLYDFPNRDFDQLKQRSPKVYSGDLYLRMPDSWNKDGRYLIQNDQPLPMTIILCVSEISNYE